ncbi:MAG: hypothetical protein ACFFE8_02705 [Candidatus Heimdallarchaeota archaeon]
MGEKFILTLFVILIFTPISVVSVERFDIERTRANISISIETVWNRTYGGIADDGAGSGFLYPPSLIKTNDGGFVLVGLTESYGLGFDDLWLIKTNAIGQSEWNKTFGGVDDERAGSVVQTTDGGFLIAGRTNSFGAGGLDVWMVKTDTNGKHEWNKTYGGTEDDFANSVIQTADGGLALVGTTRSSGAGSDDMWLVKTNASGVIEWDKTFGGGAADTGISLIQTADGGFALVGVLRSSDAGIKPDNMWLVKTNANGEVEWDKDFGGTSFDRSLSVIQAADGGYVLVGESDSYGAGLGDAILLKTDASGQQEWNNTIGGVDADLASSGIQTDDGGFILAGRTSSFGAGSFDVWMVRTDNNGQPQWNFTLGGALSESANSFIQTANNEFVIAGSTFSYGAGGADFWLIKVRWFKNTSTTSPRASSFSGLGFLLSIGILIAKRKTKE